MDNIVVQLGVGGLFAILALREVRGLMAELLARRKNANGPDTSGAKSPEFWQAELRKAAVDAFTATAMPAMTQQTEILREIRDEQRRLSDEVLKMAAKQAMRKGARA